MHSVGDAQKIAGSVNVSRSKSTLLFPSWGNPTRKHGSPATSLLPFLLLAKSFIAAVRGMFRVQIYRMVCDVSGLTNTRNRATYLLNFITALQNRKKEIILEDW